MGEEMRLSEDQLRFIQEKIPEPYNTPERFGEYFSTKIQLHNTLCTLVIAEVKNKMLLPLLKKYSYRFFCRIDSDHQTKQPASIIDKIIREKGYTLENFTTTMKDLVRFRVVCNFIKDVKEVAEAIERSEVLNKTFNIKTDNTIDRHPKERKSAERSVKLILKNIKNPGLFLEIQVMTQLSEAWDKKDHFLVYELRRRHPGKEADNFPDYLDSKMYAMGELLYVADNYFEALRESREEKEEEKKEISES